MGTYSTDFFFEPSSNIKSSNSSLFTVRNFMSYTFIPFCVKRSLALLLKGNLVGSKYGSIRIQEKKFPKKTSKIASLTSTEGSLGQLEFMLEIIGLDAFFYIISLLPITSILALRLVSKRMNWFAMHETVWMSVYKRTTGEDLLARKLNPEVSWINLYRSLKIWKWSNSLEKKAPTIQLENDDKIASRLDPEGSNPAVLSNSPLTRYKNFYEVRLQQRGQWVGIGIADSKFIIHHSSTLGTQKGGINSAFFCQDTTILQLSTCNDVIQIHKKLKEDDRIRVEINFNENSITYCRNGSYEGKLVSSVPFKEGELFPCINLSKNTRIALLTK